MSTPMDNCDFCNKDYALCEENAQLHLFIRKPEMSFIFAQCPHCQTFTRIFVSQDTICTLIDKLTIFVFSDVPGDVEESYNRIFGIVDNPIPDIISSEYEIPPSLEQEIRRLHDALNDPNFTDEMELPQPPSKLPPKWRGEDNRPGASA